MGKLPVFLCATIGAASTLCNTGTLSVEFFRNKSESFVTTRGLGVGATTCCISVTPGCSRDKERGVMVSDPVFVIEVSELDESALDLDVEMLANADAVILTLLPWTDLQWSHSVRGFLSVKLRTDPIVSSSILSRLHNLACNTRAGR